MDGISCKSLTIRRGRREIVRDFDLSASGECVVIEGIESGTVLEVLAGWRRPSSGTLSLPAPPAVRLPGEQLPSYWTGADWLSFCGSADPEVGALLGSANVRLHKMIRNLDARERNVLATLSALLFRASLYLLHEPFQGMGETQARATLDICESRAKQGAVVLLGFEHYGWPFSLRTVAV
jgi:ABC-type transport system involved in cytochrome c biogenesis ATPase subunit